MSRAWSGCWRSAGAVLALVAAAEGAQGGSGVVYEIVDLGRAPGLNSSVGVDVNGAGQVIIGSFNLGGGPTNNTGEYWADTNGNGVVDAAERVNVGSLGGGETQVESISFTATVVGSSRNGSDDTLAFRWTPGGGIIALQSLAGVVAEAFGVNDTGVAVGRARTLPLGNGSSRLHAVMWGVDGTITDISPLGASVHTYALRINNAGHVLGSRQDSGGAWVSRDGVTHFLPGSTTLIPADLSESGDASGFVRLNNVWRACRWIWTGSGYAFESLGLIAGHDDSFGYGMDNLGNVVGSAQSGEGKRAVLWDVGAGATDLNTLIPDGSGWILREARAINDDGVIVGFGDFNGEEFRAFLLRPAAAPDTDGDGLLDEWEKDGIPYETMSGTTAHFMLPGANPMRKDLYVEIDAMSGLSLQQSAVTMVAEAFAAAPVSNPDGSTGITLHVLRDETSLPFVAVWDTDGCWPIDFDAYRAMGFGTSAQRASANAEALLAAKAKAYRYGIVANRFSPSMGGCGQTPGDNFVIRAYPLAVDAAAVFMHELGHNLGLKHGGGDDVNGKPNHPSIMNYTLGYRMNWNKEFWRLDFSRAGPSALATLDESALNELTGVGSLGGEYEDFFLPFGVNVAGGMRTTKYVRLNGTATDFGDTAGGGTQDGSFDESVSQDLNYAADPPDNINFPGTASPGDMLAPHDDWARVAIGLAPLGSLGLRGGAIEYPEDELLDEAREWMDANLPLAPPLCPGDVDLDGDIDFGDLNALLEEFNTAGVQLAGDIDRDGFVDFADLNIVLSAFNTTCGGAGGPS